jgi:hypothetical protein
MRHQERESIVVLSVSILHLPLVLTFAYLDGRGLRRVITKTGLAREAGMLCPRSSSWPDSVFQVIAIHPVSDRESAAV